MKLTEMILKNFGRFSDKDIELTDGINLIYGENESGKSTVHTFLKGMLFGMERSRGRASLNDAFRMYEPWENPNYYAGTLRFFCGGRNFRIERNFDKYSKKSLLYCEDDGEELSFEHGDLEMLLGGMGEAEYENTVAIGQLKAPTGSTLAAALKNYAANYYASGSGEIDLDEALCILKGRKKELDKSAKSAGEEKQKKRDKIELEASYVWRDLHRLEKEIARSEEERRLYREKKQQREEEYQKKMEQQEQEGTFDRWRIHPVELVGMILAFILSFVLFKRPWNFLVAVVVALAEGLYVWNCMKDGSKKVSADEEVQDEEILLLEADLEKASWRYDKLKEDYKEKQIQYSNIQEQLEELDEVSDIYREQEKQRAALELAMDTMTKISRDMQDGLGKTLDDKISGILKYITGGKYDKVWADEELHIYLFSEGRKIAMEQVSRGTVEQIYFALRMAAADMMYEEKLPVILDDTFAYYDDRRLRYTLEWLAAQERQVLLFTCQKREEEILSGAGIKYHKINI